MTAKAQSKSGKGKSATKTTRLSKTKVKNKSKPSQEISKVHYLQNKSRRIQQRTLGMESFLNSLGERLGQIETQFEKNVKNLSSQFQQKDVLPHSLETKFQGQLDEVKKEFSSQIHELAQSLEKVLSQKLIFPSKASTASQNKPNKENFFRQWLRWIPRLPNWLSSNGTKQTFDKIYHEEYDPFGRDPEFEEWIRPLFNFLYYKYWRISAHGLENIPTNGRALLVGNHSGTLAYDGSMIRMAVSSEHPSGRDVRFLVEDFVYYLPFIGTFMYRVGGVRASRENAEQLLNSNHLVAVFPEGVKGIGKYYAQRYHLQRFGRGGFIKLAIRTKSPIVPVAVIGAEEIHPILYKSSLLAKPLGIPYVPITPTLPWLGPLGLLPLPSKWSIYFGEPIDFSHYKDSVLKDELKIHKLSEMVRGKIQTMVTEGLKKRRSVWFG